WAVATISFARGGRPRDRRRMTSRVLPWPSARNRLCWQSSRLTVLLDSELTEITARIRGQYFGDPVSSPLGPALEMGGSPASQTKPEAERSAHSENQTSQHHARNQPADGKRQDHPTDEKESQRTRLYQPDRAHAQGQDSQRDCQDRALADESLPARESSKERDPKTGELSQHSLRRIAGNVRPVHGSLLY